MNKNDYRTYFLAIKEVTKFSVILRNNNCPVSTFSRFLNGDNSCISIDRLEAIKKYINNEVVNFYRNGKWN